MRITEKKLNEMVTLLNHSEGLEIVPFIRDASGKITYHVGTYLLDYVYGGINLSRIVNDSGGEWCLFYAGSKGLMCTKILAFRAGLNEGRIGHVKTS